jgi:hypothetical protein
MGGIQQHSPGSGTRERTTRNTLAIVGPSTAQRWGNPVSPQISTLLSTPAQTVTAGAGFAQLNYWLNGALEFVYNGGVSGDTSSMILARAPGVTAAAEEIAPISLWWLDQLDGNDMGVMSQATSLATLELICELFDGRPGYKLLPTWVNRDAGMTGSLAKFGGGFFSTSEWAEWVRASDRWKREWVAAHDDWLLPDVHGEVTRGNLYRSNFSGDGTHPSHLGGDYEGRAGRRVLTGRIVPRSGLAEAVESSVVLGEDYFLDSGSASNELQFIDLKTATGGTFTIGVSSADSAAYGAAGLPIPAGTSAAITVTTPPSYIGVGAAVQTALDTLLGAGNTLVSGLFVTFQGIYAGVSMPLLTIDGALATGGTGSPVVTRFTGGGGAHNWALGATGNIFARLEARDDGLGNWQVIRCMSNGALATLAYSLGTRLTSGAEWWHEVEVRVDKTWSAPTRCELVLLGSTPQQISSTCQLGSGQSPDPLCFNPGPSQGVLRTPTLKTDRNYTVGSAYLKFSGNAGDEIRLGRFGPRVKL